MSVRLEKHEAVARIIIDRPDARNSINLAMWEAFPPLIADAVSDPQIRVLELRASEDSGVFSAGADIKEMIANKDDMVWLAANQAEINRVQHELARADIPTVAFVDGDCIGGGCGLALACDIRVATPNARFGITPGKLGLVYPLHDVKLLTDLVGPGQAKRMLFTAELIDAAEAQLIGLVEIISDDSSGLISQILENSTHSAVENKRFVRRVLEGQGDDDDHSLRVFHAAFSRDDFAEGSRAFVEKRKPRFD